MTDAHKKAAAPQNGFLKPCPFCGSAPVYLSDTQISPPCHEPPAKAGGLSVFSPVFEAGSTKRT